MKLENYNELRGGILPNKDVICYNFLLNNKHFRIAEESLTQIATCTVFKR